MIWLLMALTGSEPPKTGDGMACEVVRAYVRTYGEDAAHQYAKDHKWSRERVAWAETCIKRTGQ